MNKSIALVLMCGGALLGAGCKKEANHSEAGAQEHERPAAPTNRVDIPPAVRQNLGVTFAKVEARDVARTLRVPGQFELLPTARREYRAPVPGRVDLLVKQYDRVEAGTELYRVDGIAWRDLAEQIIATQAKVDAIEPLRDAHVAHEKILTEKVALWQQRLRRLEEIRAAGGGTAAQFTEAQATLSAAQTDLADVMEEHAHLRAEKVQAESQLRSLVSRREVLERASACASVNSSDQLTHAFTVCASAAGVVEQIGVTPGGLVDENGLVLSLVQPDHVRFRARALQSDLGRLRDGLPASVVLAGSTEGSAPAALRGSLKVGLTASADERTVDLIVEPESGAPWTRAGVSAQLEITLAGGSTELAIPQEAIVRDGVTPIIFKRDPVNPDKVIRMEADVGLSDGRWVVIASGVKDGDEIVVGGNYQLMLATSGSAPKGGHFHSDGTFHEGSH
jgi:multidrug resistance efflux pump